MSSKSVKCTAIAFLPLFALLYGFWRPKQTGKPAPQVFVTDTLATGLTVPWEICFLPSGEMLFTERTGRVRIYTSGRLNQKPLLTLPDIEAKGKMGLLGMCLHPAFKTNKLLYLAYNYLDNDNPRLKVVRYQYRKEGLVNPKIMIQHLPAAFNHTGCRLQFGPDKKLYITVGDADVPALAQDLKTYNGKILRLNADGTIPADNPFTNNDSAHHEIWSYGHRNPQGIAFEPSTGKLFESEHGPSGGDEINIIRKGKNYGWPVIHHREQKEGMISPLLEFTPSIGPSAVLFYIGAKFRQLTGQLLTGNMRGEAILHTRFTGDKPTGYNFMLKNQYGRIRALAQGPDGNLYFSTSQVDPPESKLAPGEQGFDMIIRLRPALETDKPALYIPTSMAATETNAINTITAASYTAAARNPATVYAQLCSSCHGTDLRGKQNVPNLTDSVWLHGKRKEEIARSVSNGRVEKGMPAWKGVLSEAEIDQLADYILLNAKKQ